MYVRVESLLGMRVHLTILTLALPIFAVFGGEHEAVLSRGSATPTAGTLEPMPSPT